MPINIAIVDDHQLFLKTLSLFITTLKEYSIVAEAKNGEELISKLQSVDTLPDIALIDVNMPVMDGVATATHLNKNFPSIRLVALSMKDDENSILNMLGAGCCAYLLKDIQLEELDKALQEIYNKGYYNSDAVNINYRRLLQFKEKQNELQLTDKEQEFVQLACSDITYKQIAARMNVSERTVDTYRENLFKKLNVQSRTGMALEAIRRNLANL